MQELRALGLQQRHRVVPIINYTPKLPHPLDPIIYIVTVDRTLPPPFTWASQLTMLIKLG